MESVQIPSSIPEWPHKPSLCNLPAELRLEVCNQLLELGKVPRSYGYTGPVISGEDQELLPTARPKGHHMHAMLFVSKQFSAEYRQCFYERTNFFLRIDSQNGFKGAPELGRNIISDPANRMPDFWGAPAALLNSLRHCTLFIELGEIASHRRSLHSVSHIARSNISNSEAEEVRRGLRLELKMKSSLAEIRAQDAAFDSAIVSAILGLLARMKQLRSIQLVWDTTIERTRSRARQGRMNTNWTWDKLGEMFVEALKRKRNMREVRVKVGDMFGDTTWSGKKVEGVWEGRLVKLDG